MKPAVAAANQFAAWLEGMLLLPLASQRMDTANAVNGRGGPPRFSANCI
jgi:hypothetical protein